MTRRPGGHGGRSDDGADGRPGDDGAARPPAADGAALVVPDDARALEPDRRAWLREQRRHRRRVRARRLLLTRRWERYGLSGPIVTLVLVGVALFGSLVVVMIPRVTPPPGADPLAARPARAAGAVGGLLPAASLETGAGRVLHPVDARTLRPGVLALVPPGCGCDDAVRTAFTGSGQYRLRLWLLGRPEQRAELDALARRTGNGTAIVVLDAADAFAAAYRPTGLTLLLVHTDGVVGAIVRDGLPGGGDQRLDVPLSVLDRPGAPG